ncbi:hypothetical protein ANCCEY_07215 [Ancylostoma ceylanicum]|uniref:Tryptophan synthase beta chain-like PALP domain-containing protein n=1 Tax=Ancylostoma ceylanicum TaxID=53326 RepID=A0A0D6LUF4_9BILA|nr:hypothetical protein ANCCEY_07215 [Ancylostoma ceylanicum]
MNQFGNADKAEEFHESESKQVKSKFKNKGSTLARTYLHMISLGGDFPLESVNLFHEILVQLQADEVQEVKVPHYFVHAAGTGGTISSVGRYVKKYGISTEIVLADTQFSVYYDYVMYDRFKNESGASLWVEPGMAGIGYGPMGMAKKGETTSIDPAVIDRVVKIPDVAATAAMRILRDQGASGGTSSGVNLITSMHVASTAK